MAALSHCAGRCLPILPTPTSVPFKPLHQRCCLFSLPTPSYHLGSRGSSARKYPNSPFRHSPISSPLLPSLRAAAASPFDLCPPPIEHDLEDMLTSGTKALQDGRIQTFENDELAISAALTEVAVMDLSHYGRIRVTGEDRVQFLHNQTTAKFDSYSEGEGCDTVFVTPTARTIDIAYSWVMKNAVVLLVSPSTCSKIAEMLNKYIFYADKVEVHDITTQTCFFSLVGPKSNEVMKALKLNDLIGQSYGTHRHYNVNGMPVTVGVGSVLFRDGFSFLLSPASAESILNTLSGFGAIQMGTNAWERLRVLQGRPAPGKELTNDFNVLEAGLWNAISLDKGCYKGQETVSRLITYDGVKQKLWGIQLSGPAEPGSPILMLDDSKKVGVLTSYSVGKNDAEHVGLGYVKRNVDPMVPVRIGDVLGTLFQVPFLSHSTQ